MYRVKFYSGSYRERQEAANRDGAICYVAHHFNSSGHSSANYALCVVGSNASVKSKEWARDYVRQVSEAFGAPLFGADGVCIGGMGGRGNSQVKYTKMPAILPKSLFCSNPDHARILRSDHGRQVLAEILADTIRTHFPRGGIVAFSIGHKEKPPPKEHDRGALVIGDPQLMEADVADDVLTRAANLIEAGADRRHVAHVNPAIAAQPKARVILRKKEQKAE